MASEANPPSPTAPEASKYPNVCSTPIKVPRPGPTFFNPQELVTFHIGSGTEKQTFLAHKEVATLYSPVMSAAFDGQSQSYTLEDVEAGVFRLMLQWLYGQKIEYYLTQAEANSLQTPQHTEEQRKLVYSKIEERQRLLVRLWVLAEMLMLPRLQNLVFDELDSIQRDWKNSFPWRCLNYVYANTAEYSPLRRLILAHCIRYVPTTMMFEHENDIPKKFLLQIWLSGYLWIGFTSRTEFRNHFHVWDEDDENEYADDED